MVIATFSPGSALGGKRIMYEDGRFSLEDSLTLSPQQVRELDRFVRNVAPQNVEVVAVVQDVIGHG